MDGRIGALHVRYRVAPGGTTAAALAPGFDRAISTRLGEAVAERLSRVLDPDPSVIVIRELHTRVTLGQHDWALDSRVVDRISRVSVDAVTDLLREADVADLVMRFANQAEFIGSFILDLLEETAWDRWYFGAFQAYRRGETRESVAAVLADHHAETARVFAWLARRGRLSDVLRLIGSAAARRLASGEYAKASDDAVEADIEPLIDAAFALVEALGWPAIDVAARKTVISRFLSGGALPPSWSDRRALSAWVLECVRAIVLGCLDEGRRREEKSAAAVHELLTGSFDWLDAEWLADRLQRLHQRPGQREDSLRGEVRLLASGHERMLARVAQRVAGRRVRFDRSDDRDAMVVRLLAAVSEESGESAPLDRAVIAAIERIADAWHAARQHGDGPAALGSILATTTVTPVGSTPVFAQELRSRVEAVRTAGAAALDVLRAMADSTDTIAGGGDPTEFAGLYLLTRGILDVRLSTIAQEAGVPFDPLRSALVIHWFSATGPFDTPTSLWLNADSGDLAPLSEARVRLADLEQSLLDTLLDQRAIEAMPPEDSQAIAPSAALLASGCSPHIAAMIARVAWIVMRAWSRWLPGLAQASPTFLIGRALVRDGRVLVSERRIDVTLEPAPLDVVLEMAGYFKPIECVPWLGGRAIVFTVRRPLASRPS